MELTGEQLQKIVDAVAERLGAVRTADPASEGVVAPAGAGPPESGAAPYQQSLPMVQLPPEFYRSQREIAERVARLEERFEQMDKRFDELIHYVDKRFDELIHYVDKRFEQMDNRFDDLIHYVDKRFVTLQWTIGIGFTVVTVLMTVYNFVG